MRVIEMIGIICSIVVCISIQKIFGDTETTNNLPVDSYGAQYQYAAQQPSTDVDDEAYTAYSYDNPNQAHNGYQYRQPGEKQDYGAPPSYGAADNGGGLAIIQENAELIGVVGALLAVLASIGVAVNFSNLNTISTYQSNICTAVKTLGAIDVSSATTTDTTTGTELNALITAVEAVSTPTCS